MFSQEKSTVEVSLGEIFDLAINVIDEIGNSKDAVYSYQSPRDLTAYPLSVIVVDLNPDEDALPTFASVNRATMYSSPYTMQKVALVMHFAEELQSFCTVNYQNFLNFHLNFSLNLIDSSDGRVVCNQSIGIQYVIVCIV